MCGVAGAIVKPGVTDRPDLNEAIRAMISCMRHRGPDGAGQVSDGAVVLGHARLSIVDLETGAQPLFNEDSTLALVYNGEVYGYQDLRDELCNRHVFRTSTDSEVLVHLYEELGPIFARRLNGMYAYILHDRSSDTVHFGVDMIGIKPLYWYEDSEILLIASELRAISVGLRSLGRSSEFDDSAMRTYLQWGWFPAPSTPLKGVWKLRPGERAEYRNGRVSVISPERTPPGEPISGDLARAVEMELSAAVGRQLVADVPIGFFLSGGIDSSLLVALAAQERTGLRTFTVGFSGVGSEVDRVNEAAVARRVASILGTDHHETTIDVSVMLEEFDEVFRAMDEPIADPAILPLLHLARFARKSVTVCLSGDGGDEVFSGYSRHWMAPYKRYWRSLPTVARRAVEAGAQLLPSRPANGLIEGLRRTRVGLELLFDADYITGPFGGPFRTLLDVRSSETAMPAVSHLDMDSLFWSDVDGQLSGQLLPKTDRITMWAGLETRVPYLDLNVVELARRLPRSTKISGFTTKRILRELLAKHLPADLAGRTKHGFRVPLSGWFRTDLRDYVLRELRDDSLIPASVIQPEIVRTIVAEHLSGAAEHSIRIWALLALNHWLRLQLTPLSQGT
jgi:asparagine synthase (glutamine-hydrolysing)